MNQEEASVVGDQLLKDARTEREPALAAVATRRQTMIRLTAAMMAIIGYYFGMQLASELTANPLLQNPIAVAVGLLAALVWPPRKQT